MLDINIEKNKVNYNIFVKDLIINNQRYDSPKPAFLKYYQNHININYLALNYKACGKINYKYRMLGVDKMWIKKKL